MYTNTISELIQISTLVGTAACASTFLGLLTFPKNDDWRDITSFACLGSLISAHYIIMRHKR